METVDGKERIIGALILVGLLTGSTLSGFHFVTDGASPLAIVVFWFGAFSTGFLACSMWSN